MPDQNIFIANLNDCAKQRLAQAGIRITTMETIKDGFRSFQGYWVTRACARKIWQNCARNNETEKVFDLFEKVGRSPIIQILSHRIPSFLGASAPLAKKDKKKRSEIQGEDLSVIPIQIAI